MIEHHTHKKHIISLYVIIVVLLASQVFTMYFLILRTTQISFQINNTYSEMQNFEKDTNNKIIEISTSLGTAQTNIQKLTTSQSSFQQQISEIKASASSDFSGILDNAIKGVVTIKTNVAQGTGFIITNDGYVVTNAHILSGGSYANLYTYDNSKYSAELVGYDTNIDIAILKISGSFNKLTLGNSNDVKVGEKVIAIGNPLGLSFSATEGIVSAVDRVGINNLPAYIQTDAALNPGNSGGPLIDTSGEVIGINNFKATGENIGFALESNYIKTTVNNIAQQDLNMTIV